MSLFLPFNHRPSNTTVATGSYTVPSGKYARITVLEADSGFTLNGTTIISQLKYQGSTSADGSGYFENTTNYNLKGTVGLSNFAGNVSVSIVNSNQLTSPIYLSDNTQTIVQGESYTVNLAPGDKITPAVNNVAATLFWSLTAYESVGSLSSPIWLDTGDSVSGTKYLVEEYDIP